MFLNALKIQNQALIEAAYLFWKQKKIRPDSYVIDLDQLLENAKTLLKSAQENNVKLYAMTKQIGRNPLICKKLLELGFEGIVAVDFKEAELLSNQGIFVAHVGHLVQPPTYFIEKIIPKKPQAITVFSIEKTKQINEIAKKNQLIQPILLKVYDENDTIYPAQEAGFLLKELPQTIAEIKLLENIKIIGATHFPCVLFDEKLGENKITKNFETLKKAIDCIKSLGINVEQFNAPSANSCEMIPILAKLGATHLEPGHALTGTQPKNQFGDQKEKIAMLYLSEVSHHFKQKSLCFGGGFYPRGKMQNAMIKNDYSETKTQILPFDKENIDYHFTLKGNHEIASAVIMCFRTQIFVTKSDVVLIENIKNSPKIAGIFTSQGYKIEDFS